MADYTNYTNREMQAISIAKSISDGQIAIVGTGLPPGSPLDSWASSSFFSAILSWIRM